MLSHNQTQWASSSRPSKPGMDHAEDAPLYVCEVKLKGRKPGGERRAGTMQCHERYQRPEPLFICKGETAHEPFGVRREFDTLLVPSADVLSYFGCFLVPIFEGLTNHVVVFLTSTLEEAFLAMQRSEERRLKAAIFNSHSSRCLVYYDELHSSLVENRYVYTSSSVSGASSSGYSKNLANGAISYLRSRSFGKNVCALVTGEVEGEGSLSLRSLLTQIGSDESTIRDFGRAQ